MKKHVSAKAFIKKYKTGTLFVLPFFVFFAVFTIIPIVSAMGLSLTDYNLLETPNFVGLTNYRLLFLEDSVFMTAVKNTLIFAVVTGPVGLILSFLLAWVINRAPLKNFFSLLVYVPSITSGIAMSVVWMYFFSPDRYGLINNLLFELGAINEPILWNLDEDYILIVCIIISIWLSMGASFLVFLAGLKNTSRELTEAGKIDGIKNGFQELIYITLPQMKPQLLFGCINALTASVSAFEIPMGVAGFPSPNYAGHTIVAHLYDYAFVRFQMGYAAAIAVVLFFFTFILGRVLMRVLSSRE